MPFPTRKIENWRKPWVEDGKPTKWNWVAQHIRLLAIEKNSDIGAFTYISAEAGVEIGESVQVGSHCAIYSVSTIDGKKGKVILKRNCKIGSHSVIMPGVTIGENSVIGAFSFVNKNIPDNVIAYGCPAKVIRKIKPEEIVN